MTDKERVEEVREGIKSVICRWDYDITKSPDEQIDEILSLKYSNGKPMIAPVDKRGRVIKEE